GAELPGAGPQLSPGSVRSRGPRRHRSGRASRSRWASPRDRRLPRSTPGDSGGGSGRTSRDPEGSAVDQRAAVLGGQTVLQVLGMDVQRPGDAGDDVVLDALDVLPERL